MDLNTGEIGIDIPVSSNTPGRSPWGWYHTTIGTFEEALHAYLEPTHAQVQRLRDILRSYEIGQGYRPEEYHNAHAMTVAEVLFLIIEMSGKGLD